MSGEPPGGPDRVNPPKGGGSRSGRNRAAVAPGVLLGFMSWVFAMFFVVTSTLDSTTGAIDPLVTWTLVAVFVCAVGLIVWPRTRRLGEGFLLGFAIGLVVAGGLCLPTLVPSL